MEKILKIVFGICMACSIFILSCKKDSSNNDNNIVNSKMPQKISSVLISNDSINQFAGLIKLISISNSDIEGGVTVLALTNNALINPSDPNNLKDYIVKGIIPASELKSGKTLTSITGKQILISEQKGKVYANGSMISVTPVASAGEYIVYPIACTYYSSDSTYDDTHKNEYYIEYYENGIYHKLNWGQVTSWQFFNFNNFPINATGGCLPTYHSYSSGPSQYTSSFPVYTTFSLQINRMGFSSKPETGIYQISKSTEDTVLHSGNTGNCDLIIDGARYGCDLGDKDSYIKVNITEVKVEQDLGLEKRGYYKGEFDAILYFAPAFGVYQKRVITSGRFMAPMGNNGAASLNGSAPEVDRLSILTTGKWYWRPIIEQSLLNQEGEYYTCNIDDYWVFRADGTMDCRDGGIQCEPHYSGIEYWDNISWSFENNQTRINLSNGALVWPILEMTDSILDFGGGFRFAHGN